MIPRFVKNRHFYLIFYGILSFLVLSNLLAPGMILTLDIRLGPNIDLASHFFGLIRNVESAIRLPFTSIGFFLNRFLPFWLWQKVLFLTLFFLAGVGAHRLLPVKGAGNYFAGLLYTINPFTYVRFLAGQWAVLAVYALTPFAVKTFIGLLEKPDLRNALKVSLFATLVGVMYEHGFLLLFIVFAIFWLVRIVTLQQWELSWRTTKYVVVSAIAFILLNTFWLVPLLTSSGTVVERIGQPDLLSFAPLPTSRLGVMFDIASMYGFWRGGYFYTKDVLPLWWLLFAVILYLAVFGFLSFCRDKNLGWIVVSSASAGILGFFLAVGASSDMTKPFFEWLFRNVPFFNIFRDSHKFVVLLCLAYAFLGGLGLNQAAGEIKQSGGKIARLGLVAIVVLVLAVPPLYSFKMFGFGGELGVTDYPAEWYEANTYLNQDKSDFNVLFLPWHEFMDFSWLPNRDKRLGNPARAFFNKPVIQGDNIEMPDILTQSDSPISRYVEFLLEKKDAIDNFGELLVPLNVKYIILVGEADFGEYDFLYRQTDLIIVKKHPELTLFQNTNQTARVYGAGNVVPIDGLDEYLERSKSENVMDNIYVLDGSSETIGQPMPSSSIDYVMESPVKYRVAGTPYKYFVFTVTQVITTNNWEYNGTKPLNNLGFMPAFASDGRGGEIVYTRFFKVCLPAYIISFVSVAVILLYGIGTFIKKKLKLPRSGIE